MSTHAFQIIKSLLCLRYTLRDGVGVGVGVGVVDGGGVGDGGGIGDVGGGNLVVAASSRQLERGGSCLGGLTLSCTTNNTAPCTK